MAINYTPASPVGGSFTALQIKDELDKIQTALLEAVSREGNTPNQMEAALDLNSKRLINVANAVDANDAPNLAQVNQLIEFFQGSDGWTNQQFDDLLQSLTYKKGTYLHATFAPIDIDPAAQALTYKNTAQLDADYAGKGESVITYDKVLRTFVPDTSTNTEYFEYQITAESLNYGNTFAFVYPYTATGGTNLISFNIGRVSDPERTVTIMISTLTNGEATNAGSIRVADSAHISHMFTAKDIAENTTNPDETNVYNFRTINSGRTWYLSSFYTFDKPWDDIADFTTLLGTVVDGDTLGGYLNNEFNQSEPNAALSEWEGSETGMTAHVGTVPWGDNLFGTTGYHLPAGLATLYRDDSDGSNHWYPANIAAGDWWFSVYVWLGNSTITKATLSYEDHFRIQYKDTGAMAYIDVLDSEVVGTAVHLTSAPDVYRVNVRVTGVTFANLQSAEVGIRKGAIAETPGQETVWNGFQFSYEDTGKTYIGTNSTY